MPEHRSAKVRRILQLQGRAATLQARYESTMARIASARYQAAELRQQVEWRRSTPCVTEGAQGQDVTAAG